MPSVSILLYCCRGSMGRPNSFPRAPLYRNPPPLMGQVTIPDDQRAARVIMGAIRHAGVSFNYPMQHQQQPSQG